MNLGTSPGFTHHKVLRHKPGSPPQGAGLAQDSQEPGRGTSPCTLVTRPADSPAWSAPGAKKIDVLSTRLASTKFVTGAPAFLHMSDSLKAQKKQNWTVTVFLRPRNCSHTGCVGAKRKAATRGAASFLSSAVPEDPEEKTPWALNSCKKRNRQGGAWDRTYILSCVSLSSPALSCSPVLFS